jgi:hypothetical protein
LLPITKCCVSQEAPPLVKGRGEKSKAVLTASRLK